ncbi:hypothetical protein [Streptomyces sp. NPDC059278]|uniref:hypothetical protein n=1 Tax=Streptomyces sp. NPDC059278 TaxID=3346801 RepID=UPI0036CA7BC3
MDDIKTRMAAAAQAEEQGQYREAAHLYSRLGKDIQAQCGRFDSRALDAFEGVSRAIRKGAEASGSA